VNIVARYLDRRDIVLDLNVAEKTDALEAIAAHFARHHGIEKTTISSALIRREKSGSTAVGHGLAIPHARIAGIDQPLVMLARTGLPIKFGAPDHHPVSVLLAIVVPERANDEHLEILGNVAAMFASETFRAQLAHAGNSDTVFRLLAEWHESGNDANGV